MIGTWVTAHLEVRERNAMDGDLAFGELSVRMFVKDLNQWGLDQNADVKRWNLDSQVCHQEELTHVRLHIPWGWDVLKATRKSMNLKIGHCGQDYQDLPSNLRVLGLIPKFLEALGVTNVNDNSDGWELAIVDISLSMIEKPNRSHLYDPVSFAILGLGSFFWAENSEQGPWCVYVQFSQSSIVIFQNDHHESWRATIFTTLWEALSTGFTLEVKLG